MYFVIISEESDDSSLQKSSIITCLSNTSFVNNFLSISFVRPLCVDSNMQTEY